VTATFHDEAQFVLAGEIHGSDDVPCRPDGHGIFARARRPRSNPAERLGQPDFVAKIIGVLKSLEERLQLGSDGASIQAASGDWTLMSCPPTSWLSRFQLVSDGHSGSPGRTREKGAALIIKACSEIDYAYHE
jgi:hypothetical protein